MSHSLESIFWRVSKCPRPKGSGQVVVLGIIRGRVCFGAANVCATRAGRVAVPAYGKICRL